MREVLVKAVNEDYGDALDALACSGLPVTMVWGERDTAATTAMAEQARARIGAAADLVVVPGSAHLLDRPLWSPPCARPSTRRRRCRERHRQRAGRAGDLAARGGVVPALVAGRPARALRARPAGRDVGDLVPGAAGEPPGPRGGARALPGRVEGAAGRAGRRGRVAAVAARAWRCCGRAKRLVWTAARAPARGDHDRAARGGHRLLPGLRRGGRAGAPAGAADRRGRAAGRAPARGAPQQQVRGRRGSQDQAGAGRGSSRSPGPTARRRPRTTPRT